MSHLRRSGVLTEWSDREILPGQKISEKIRKEMDRADIFVFLLSQNFIASDECMKEWNYAKQSLATSKPVFRIPIILADCAWMDLLESDDVKALPDDGKPVDQFDNTDTPWQQVYEGLKEVTDQLRENFTPRQKFLDEIEETGFSSQKNIKLDDIFIFPTLKYYPLQAKSVELVEEEITSESQLLSKKHILIHGEDTSGKTALSRHLFLFLCNQSKAVLLVDSDQVTGKPREKTFLQAYQEQFNGDYSLWAQNQNKTIIIDNLSPNVLDFVVYAKQFFSNIIIISSSDSFYSFFKDESRLSDFHEMGISPLTHVQQEYLIRKRMVLLEENEPVTDGVVDQIENRVNSIIISNKFVPRYPFFVLSILQTYEAFMPDNLSISSYGHCYHALIVANLIKSGISEEDNAINACFNFAEKLAFRLYEHSKNNDAKRDFDFEQFITEYNIHYIILKPILSRLQDARYGILTNKGAFRVPYMYYFFLGRFFSKDRDKHVGDIEQLCDESYIRSNHLILLFIIHHTSDISIIDDILLRTMCALDEIDPAVLNERETKKFANIIEGLPANILSNSNVDQERQKERENLDRARGIDDSQDSEDSAVQHGHPANDLYRILKCNKVLGQILRNQYGIIEKKKIEEIVEAIADGGLRLVNWILKDEDEIRELADYIRHKYHDYDAQKIENVLRWISFVWTMVNIERVVGAINTPEIREEVSRVVRRKGTPAYDLVGYFSHLDSASELTEESKKQLAQLLKKHNNPKDLFVRNVLSIRTQHYMNTHRSRATIEQSICSLLNIKYSYRPNLLG